MICLTRFSSPAVSTRPQNETVSPKWFALQQRRDSEAATSRVEHLEEKVQQNLTRQLYGANGQSPDPSAARTATLISRSRADAQGGALRHPAQLHYQRVQGDRLLNIAPDQ